MAAERGKCQDDEAVKGRPGAATCAKQLKLFQEERTESTAVEERMMERIAAPENLRAAMKEVRANKGAPGVDRQSVYEVDASFGKILPELRKDLLEGRYQPGIIRRAWIPKAGGGKRGLGIPNVIDRVVQEAIRRELTPLYEPTFHTSSHGFRMGRGAQTALTEAKGYIEEGRGWSVDIDLEKFFDTVNHDRLLTILGRKIEDRRVLSLICKMLKAKVVLADGVVVANDEGTPQGGPLSPLLSNIVLHELDEELSRRGHKFVRYADDCAPRGCTGDEGRSLGAVFQEEAPKHLKLLQ